MQLTVKQYDFTSPCNLNNFDRTKNGGGQLGSFNA